MRKVVVYELLSLDGVAEKPDGFFADWDDAMEANLGAVIAAQDSVILGRRSYEEWAEFWAGSDIEPTCAPSVESLGPGVALVLSRVEFSDTAAVSKRSSRGPMSGLCWSDGKGDRSRVAEPVHRCLDVLRSGRHLWALQ
jgi:hypothetical protein